MTKAFVKFCLMTASFAWALLLAANPAQAATVEAAWNSAGDVPVTSAGYDATGNSVNVALNFAPPAGTNLTLVNNTGLDFIMGKFSNLAQGQAVALDFGVLRYRFVANYYGGSGNDLVLQWANVRPMAWGRNHYGQLGDNSTTQSNVPVAVLQSAGVLAGKTVISVSAGEGHSLALCSDGTMAAWGWNQYGQLGNNSTTNSSVPVAVQQSGVLAGKTVIAVGAGYDYSLALCSDGTLAAWGYNYWGQLGTNSGSSSSSVPVAVQQSSGVLSGKTVVAISAGRYHSLALCSDGTVAAWGYNSFGQFGNNTTDNSSVPVAALQSSGVLSGKTVIAVSAGGVHSLALCSDGTVAACGWNFHGQLGNNSTLDSKVPVAVRQSSGVLAGKTVIEVAAGQAHSLVRCSDGTLAAWGYNTDGSLGDNSTTKSSVPVAVLQNGILSGKTVIGVAAGYLHSLAMCADGTLASWGDNDHGQLGDSSPTQSSVPLAVSTTSLADGERLTTAASGSAANHTFALAATLPPEITVRGASVDIADGDSTPRSTDLTDFGSVPTAGGSVVRTFAINNFGTSNTGTAALALSSVTVAGPGAADFSITKQPLATVGAGASTTFQVTFNPNANGLSSAELSFIYNGRDETPFNFSIQGTGLNSAPTAIALSTTSIAENNVPNATVGTLLVTDADPGDVPTFSLVSGTGSTDNGSFSIEGTALKLTPSADFETKSSYAIRIGVSDGLGGTFESPFIITITDGLDDPIVTTPTIAGITATGADLGGSVIFDGGTTITERGVVYSVTATNADPSIGGPGVTKVTAEGTTGVFVASVTGLSPGTGYSFKAYAINSQGICYTSARIFGTGITFTYSAAADVPVTVANFTAGGTAALTLGYVPVTGTNLMLVNNTGRDPISGAFSNLAHGQTIALTFGRVTYQFVANYRGGSGNDLVLQWANVRPVAWGRNLYGQLANNSTTDSNVPLAVVQSSGALADKTVISVAAGTSHSLALCLDGTVAAWGRNVSGQLGNNSTTDSSAPVPVLQSGGVLSGKTVIAVAAGDSHSLALCSDGSVAAWGHNGYGQLGNDSTTQSNVPVAVQQSSGVLSGKTVVAIAAGNHFSWALCSDGTLAAWGRSTAGHLGTGGTTSSRVPVAVLQNKGVLADKTVIAVAAGSDHSMALCSDGTLAAWGRNDDGQLGNNSTTDSNVPVAVQQSSGVLLGKTVIAVAAGAFHSLVLCADGTLASWGSNTSGRLGTGTGATYSPAPVGVRQSSGVLLGKTAIAVAAGNAHSLALCADGTLASWGLNSYGQLGDSTTVHSSNIPLEVSTNTLPTGIHFTTVGSSMSASHNVALVAAAAPTEITVSGNSVAIADGDTSPSSTDLTDFGSTATSGGTVVRTFTISNAGGSNPGNTALTLGSVAVGGANAADFTVTTQPAASIDIAGSTTFQVTFDPSANGLRSATLSFNYNGSLDNPFHFSIQGTGLNSAPTAIALSATSISENNAANAIVGTLSVTDADLGDTHTFNLVGGAGSTDNSKFTVAGGVLKITPVTDFETKSSYAIRIRASDGKGGTFESPFVITIIDELDVPIVTTPTIANLADTAADLGGNVTFDGGTTITERGVIYAATAINAAPTIGGTGVTKVTADGTTGVFTAPVTGLSPGTAYSFRAYASNSQGTSYTSVGKFGSSLTFTYTAATDLPVTAADYTASGGSVILALGHAPVTGEHLTVVNNTGLSFIKGTFGNLAQGQVVALSYGGLLYRFVANYYGGTGNDLVLQWAGLHPMSWGRNDSGQLGHGNLAQRNLPVAVQQSGVLSGKTVIAVAAGDSHSLALCSDGALAAWGDNGWGQLGNYGGFDSTTPVAVAQPGGVLLGKTVIAVAAGSDHSLALCSDGTLASWGYNFWGQLGNNSTTNSNAPGTVPKNGALFGKTVIAVAAGSIHSIALCSDGTLAAWGYNLYGQLGNDSTANSSVPVAVLQSSGALSGKTVIAVAAGQHHSLALCSDGTVAAWGRNTSGQLGNESTTNSSVPVAVLQSSGTLAGKTVIAIAAGNDHTLALCSDDTLAAWGSNLQGQLGNNSTTSSSVPVAVQQSGGVLSDRTLIAAAAGGFHSLALCSDGTLAAWGRNDSGQLGNNTTTQSSIPVVVNSATLAPGEIFATVGSGKSADHTLALVAAPLPPEITVSGNSVEIADGDSTPGSADFTDFGSTGRANGIEVRTFTISNSGISNAGTNRLRLENVTVTGPGASDFTVTTQPAPYVDIAGSTTFEVTFDPTANGLRSALLSFSYNGDRDENPFNFSIQGTGVNSVPIAILLSATTITENNVADATVGTLWARDANPEDLHTFSLVSGDGSTDNSSFTITGDALKLTHSADFETKRSYAIRIGVNDGQGGTLEQKFIITIIDELDVPSVAGPIVGGISATAAEFGGNVTFNGGTPITQRGVLYAPTSINATPGLGGVGVITVTAEGTMGGFTVPVTGLSPTTDYSVRAYASNAQGTGYTSVARFSTGFTSTYTAASNVPVTAANFTAGGAITLALDYAPVTGTNLMLVNNTGRDFIQGAFSNLAHGQAVTLTFGGVIYHFVANYYGGSGNDLVLHWAKVRPLAWGNNGNGKLGNNGMAHSSVPTAVLQSGVLAGKTVIAVAAGGQHSLALCADGTVAAWGDNAYGQLGNNSTVDSSVPVLVRQDIGVLASKTVIAIAAGDVHSVVLCSDGTLAAWGYNGSGQLGTGSTSLSRVPVAVQQSGVLAGKSVIAISAGRLHSLALCSDGTLAAWGNNVYGQLGNNSTADSSVPVAVLQSDPLAGKTVSAIAGGRYHSLALCTDGTLAAWGDNSIGQLGNNSSTPSSVPVAVRQSSGVLFGKTVVALAAGGYHSLVLCADNTLAAWGNNGYGQLGNNSTTKSIVPVAVRQNTGVLFGKTVSTISAGESHSLALCADGTLAAWGFNSDGQSGNNSTTQSNVPVSTTPLPAGQRFNSAEAGAAAFHALALAAMPPVPEISVNGNSVAIADGDGTPDSGDFTDFGDVALGNTQVTRVFTIRNEGDVLLNLTGTPRVQIFSSAAADFEVTAVPAATLAPGAATDFAITFDPSLPGLRSAVVSIASDDPANGNFTFVIQGFGQLTKSLAQTITFTAPSTIYLAQSPLQLTATASSGLPVSLALVSAPAGTTLVDGLLTCASAGTVKIQATQSGGGNYAPAKTVMLSLAVKANPTALTLTRLSQIYDGTPKPISAEGAEGEVEITYTVNGASTATPPTNAGSYTVKAVAGAATKTGKLVIAKAPLYVTPGDQRKFAGQANPTLTATYSGFIGPDNESVITQLPVLSTTAKPTSPGGQYPITAKGGSAANYMFVYRQGTLMVESFAGSYEALLKDGAGLPVGKLTLTVPLSGQTFTGKLSTAEETAALPLAGTLATDPATELAAGQTTAKVKTIPYAVSITLPLYGDVLATATRNSVPLGSASDGRKLLALPTGGKVAYAGAHTVVLEPATPAGATVPAGAGWATAKISTAGVITLAGKLGDGTAFTSTVAPDGDSDPGYRLFVQPYLPARTHSHLGGQFRLKAHPNVLLPGRRYLDAASMTWTKAAKPADASYRAGFDPATTVLTLDPWQPPSAKSPLVPLLGLGSATFSVTHSTTGNLTHDERLPASAQLSATHAISVLQPLANTTKWKATLVPSTGTFTGSFILFDGAPTVYRTVPFTGVLRQPPATPALPGTVIGDGHYLLPPLSGTEKTSGSVTFTRP